jgi:hypothetical protein
MRRRDFLGLGGGSILFPSLASAALVRAQAATAGPVVETGAPVPSTVVYRMTTSVPLGRRSTPVT